MLVGSDGGVPHLGHDDVEEVAVAAAGVDLLLQVGDCLGATVAVCLDEGGVRLRGQGGSDELGLVLVAGPSGRQGVSDDLEGRIDLVLGRRLSLNGRAGAEGQWLLALGRAGEAPEVRGRVEHVLEGLEVRQHGLRSALSGQLLHPNVDALEGRVDLVVDGGVDAGGRVDLLGVDTCLEVVHEFAPFVG